MPRRAPLLAGCLVTLAACDPAFSIHGRVAGCDSHAPIVGVHVEMFYGDRARDGHAVGTDYTDPEGEFGVGDIGQGDGALTLRLTKPGYATKEEHLPKATERHVEYCLERADNGTDTPDEDGGADQADDDAG